MTIATLMATCVVFVALGRTGDVYQAVALCVGRDRVRRRGQRGSDVPGPQDGLSRRRDPKRQQIGLIIGVLRRRSSSG